MKNNVLRMLTFIVSILFLGILPSYAAGLTIGDGAALVLNDVSMNLGCSDIIIEEGGTLEVGSGAITRVRYFNILTGGIYITGTGTVSQCGSLLPGMIELLLLN